MQNYFSRIYENLCCLKEAEWLDEHRQGNYDAILKNIKQKIYKIYRIQIVNNKIYKSTL